MRQRSFSNTGRLLSKVFLCTAVTLSALSFAPTALETLASRPIQLLASAQADEIVNACGAQIGSSPIFSAPYSRPYNVFGIKIENFCGAASGAGQYNLELFNDNTNQVAAGGSAGLIANAPPGLGIVQASVPSMSLYGTLGTGYVANMVWTGGQQRVDDNWTAYNIPFARPGVPGFGFTLTCAGPGSCPSDGAHIGMNQVQLIVDETVPPSLAANGGSLWYEGSGGGASSTQWVRGTWSLGFSASAPSGIASMSASMTGETIGGPPAPPCWLPGTQPTAPFDPTTQWQQCNNGQNWTPTVTLAGNGAEQLTLSATSVAGNKSPYTEWINVDTTQPQVNLAGPSEASSLAGTQHVTATATVGPSGLGALDCSVDGGPAQSYSTSPASVPVSGLGMHSVQCTATSRSYDPSGAPATSPPADWSLDIQQPSAMAATFAKIRGLKCGKVRMREKIPAHWVTVRRHGKPVRVKRRARMIVHRVRQCRARVVTRKICHAHHCRKQQFVVPPHTALMSKLRVRYGHSAPVFGQLITSSDTPLSGQPVQIMTAPDNGSGAFTEAATATTNANGAWSAVLPPGPGRLVEAVYPGTSTVAQATSGQLQLIVPAKVKLLSVSPRRVAWGQTVRITGRLLGGYLPAGGVNVRLRIGFGSHYTTYGVHEHVAGDGRFSTTYPFGLGSPGVFRTYWFAVASLPSGNYPWAPAASGRKYVTVGGHPRTTTTTHHKRKRRRKRRRR
jgi:hypothetical protein